MHAPALWLVPAGGVLRCVHAPAPFRPRVACTFLLGLP